MKPEDIPYTHMDNESHVYHHYDKTPETIKVKLMKMSKGYQWEITFEHVNDVTVLDTIASMNKALTEQYGEPVTA